ncbi:hypothetical protein Rctr71_054 [Virus Rctr71]|nr:hypothetical protein Rctr71_054 [Virus Rctr71]
MDELKELAQQVASHRHTTSILQGLMNQMKEAFESETASLRMSIATEKAVLEDAEKKLKEVSVRMYLETGQKQLPFGIGIRAPLKPGYDATEAFEWALEHKVALALDPRKFEEHAATERLEFVEWREVVTVTLPTDINKLKGV